MVSNCANPACATPLLRLRDGKLFQFEVKSISVPCVDESNAMPSEAPVRQVAHYWLCGACADQMSLVLEINAVRLAPHLCKTTVGTLQSRTKAMDLLQEVY
jgi:hypothetical protein